MIYGLKVGYKEICFYNIHICLWDYVQGKFTPFAQKLCVKYEPTRAMWIGYMLWKKESSRTSLNVTLTHWPKARGWNITHIRPKKKKRKDMIWTRIFIYICFDLNLRRRNTAWGHCTPFTKIKKSQAERLVEGRADGQTVGRQQSGSLYNVYVLHSL